MKRERERERARERERETEREREIVLEGISTCETSVWDMVLGMTRPGKERERARERERERQREREREREGGLYICITSACR